MIPPHPRGFAGVFFDVPVPVTGDTVGAGTRPETAPLGLPSPAVGRNRCRWCNLAIYRQRGGWRHTVSGRRLCGPGRVAEPRSQAPAPGVPPCARVPGGADAFPPRGMALKSGPGRRARVAAGPGIQLGEDAAAWQALKQHPAALAGLLRWLELGGRVVECRGWGLT